MSLRRSARARVPASDPDATFQVTAGSPSSAEKKKRKRSTVSPAEEASQSPSKAGSPSFNGSPLNNVDVASSSSPSASRPAPRKIIVKTTRTGGRRSQQPEERDHSSLPPAAAVETNGGPTSADSHDLKTEDGEQEAQELQELYMTDDDRKKLETVLRVYAPELLEKRAEQSIKKQERHVHTTTLEQALSQTPCSIRNVRNHIVALRAPLTSATALRSHLSSSHIAPSKEEIERDRKKLSIMTMVLAIVDEIGSRARAAAGKVDTLNEDPSVDLKRTEGEYALHMRIPSGDYFTNAIRLGTKEALQLDSGYSKLVSITTQSHSATPPPTLGERLQAFRIPRRKEKAAPQVDYADEDVIKPVSHLYYGPWSSFAPTYDSFDGNLSLQASCALWRAKREDRKVLTALAKEPRTQRQELEDVLGSLADVDAGAILEQYDELHKREEKAVPDLERNAQLIDKLDHLQRQRWKRTFAKRLLTKKSAKGNDIAEGKDKDEPSQEEREVAAEILDTLSDLLSVNSGRLSELIPSSNVLRAASDSVCIDPALVDGNGEPGYWGSLNEAFYGPDATRRVTGGRSVPVKPPAAIRDNETIRMESANEDKVSATLTHPLALKGKGLLDKFAMARNYTLEDHPHDRKLVVPGSQQSVPSQTQQHQAQPSPQSNQSRLPSGPLQSSYRGAAAMSPPGAAAVASPVRPYPPQMRPSPSPSSSYLQQQQPLGNKTAYAQYKPAPSHSPLGNWSQGASSLPQNQGAFYPNSPYSVGRPPSNRDQRFVSGSPS